MLPLGPDALLGAWRAMPTARRGHAFFMVIMATATRGQDALPQVRRWPNLLLNTATRFDIYTHVPIPFFDN
jgi:hypothetical protein